MFVVMCDLNYRNIVSDATKNTRNLSRHIHTHSPHTPDETTVDKMSVED
jgi:hypothetical protein